MKINIQANDWYASFPMSKEGITLAKMWLDAIAPKVRRDG